MPRQTALTASLDGVDEGRPFTVLGAEVAAKATVVGREGGGVDAPRPRQAPCCPAALVSLIEVEQVTSTATCAAGEKPVAYLRTCWVRSRLSARR